MLTLDKPIKLTDDCITGKRAVNLCDRFSDEDLDRIGNHVWEGYDRDKRSRFKWERRTQAAMDLAMQLQETKNFPWPNASNVKFPLVTIAALQCHSRAYPAIILGPEIAKCRIIGADATGEKTARSNRIATHMSWQYMEEDKAWEEQKDRLLLSLPIVGTVFTKAFFNAEKGYRETPTVLAQDLVLDYWAKSVETCPRKTHIVPMFRNELHTAIKLKTFRDVTEEAWYMQPPANPNTVEDRKRDVRKGQFPGEPDETTPFICLEQHVDLDLDDDGYAEPYIITIESESHKVLRIVTGFDRPEDIERAADKSIIRIMKMEYFTKYEFLPSPDGGIYGVGFGVLLGPLNEATNSLINQLIDAGTWSITAGGFLGRGAKIRGGTYTFAPREWKRMDSTGDDLRKSIVPLEVREPSQVLLQLLTVLINYVERLSGTTDPMVGENVGQNTTAETMRTMVQEGQRVYNAVFKRIWRSMKEEFKKGYVLNGLYMPTRKSFGEGQVALREDYLGNPDEVVPSADPNVTSEQMQIAQVQLLKQDAAQTPGYDIEEVTRRYLKVLKIDAPDRVFPGVAKMGAPKDVKIQLQEMKNALATAELRASQQQFVATLMETRRMNEAEIVKIMADIEDMKVSQVGDVEDRQIGKLNAMLGFLKQRNDVMTKQVDTVLKVMEMKHEQSTDDGGDVR